MPAVLRRGALTRDALTSTVIGRIELVLAAALAVLAVVLERLTNQPWQPTALDLAACAAAAATIRWPRAAGTVLGVILTVYIFIPPPWATLGEYALMIPILCSGMRGRHRDRAVMSGAYFVILAALSVVDAPAARNPVLGWIAWAALIGVLWVIGNVFLALTNAQRKARAAELVLQRQTLARQLHDTVARSLTQIALAAERARLRGVTNESDLELIADTARKGNDELRLLMALLRDPTELRPEADPHSQPVEAALAAARNALTRLGFQVSVVIQGSPARLTSDQAALMTDAIGEATANILKHAEPDTACGIVFDVSESQAELMFVNRRREGPADAQLTSMGLDNLTSSLARLGGALVVDGQLGHWTTRVVLPLAAGPTQLAAGGT